jgi:hypothetical protein
MHARPKDDRTADVRTTFQRDKASVNPDTGEKEDGHWCKLCQYVIDLNITFSCHVLHLCLERRVSLVESLSLLGVFLPCVPI